MNILHKNTKYELYEVKVTYVALVNAKNKTHAANLLVDFKNDVYDMTRKYIGIKPFTVNEGITKVKKV